METAVSEEQFEVARPMFVVDKLTHGFLKHNQLSTNYVLDENMSPEILDFHPVSAEGALRATKCDPFVQLGRQGSVRIQCLWHLFDR